MTSHFKTDMKNVINFDPSTRKSQKFGLLLAVFGQSIYFLNLESIEELRFMALTIDAKFEGKLTCAF